MAGYKRQFNKCPYEGPCFGRTKNGECAALNNIYFKDGKCHFQKPVAQVTKGKTYLFNPEYESEHRRE